MAKKRATGTRKPAKKAARAPSKAAPKRVRRTADEARRIILDAAEQQLLASGPGSLRLQQVARAAGVSHPTVLHHFGTREGLVREVVHRAMAALRAELLGALDVAGRTHDPVDPVDLVQRFFQSLTRGGHARFWVWLVLSGEAPPADETWVRDVALAAHARREEWAAGAPVPPFEDTLFRTVLAGLAVFGDAIVGPSFRTSAGIAEGSEAAARFGSWMGTYLTAWLAAGAAPGARRPPPAAG